MSNVNHNIDIATSSLGATFWMRVPQDVHLPLEQVEAVAEIEGFDDFFKAPTQSLAISRAVQSFQCRLTKNDKSLGEVVSDNSKRKVWGILGIRNNGEKVTYVQDTTITLDKESGTVTAEGAQGSIFMARYETFKDAIIDDDVRSFLQRVRRMCHGINLREGSGGIYFIPQRFVALMESAQVVLDKLSTGAKVYLLPMYNTEHSRDTIWESVEREVGNGIDKLLGEAERIQSRVSSFKLKQDKLTELDGLMTVYTDLLGAEAQHEEVAERLKDAGDRVKVLMTKLQEGKATTVAKTIKVNAGTQVNPWISAAKTVLANAGVPMHYRAITEQALADGLIESKGKTPWTTMATAIVRYGDGEVVSVGKGEYELANA